MGKTGVIDCIKGMLIKKGAEPDSDIPENVTKIDDSSKQSDSLDRPESGEISDSVKNQVNRVIENSDMQKFRYFLIELIRKNTGISMPSVKQDSRFPTQTTVRIPGKFREETSVLSIVMRESIKNKQVLTQAKKLQIGNCSIELNSSYSNEGGFEIQLNGKLTENDMELIRDFFEKVFLSEFIINEQSLLHVPQLRELLELKVHDFVSINDTIIQVSIVVDQDVVINDALLNSLVVHLNTQYDSYSVKYKKLYSSGENVFSGKIVIYDIARHYNCNIQLNFKPGMISLQIGEMYNELNIDKKFIETVLKQIIYVLSENKKVKLDPLRSLKNMGVMVFEKDSNEKRKTLNELYQEDGFVGYEDIKKLLASNIIHPWEQKEEYIRIAREEFPNMKGIIPNTALFEGPPGTGKTTQAKIIGKYLGYPFIYIPIGKIMAKWFGESESRLDAIFDLAGKAAEEYGGIIVMIDEIDEIGKNREQSYEATGRITGVLLKKLDGIEKVANLLLIGSTNRKDSLDSALLSRFSRQVYFRLPDLGEIRHILSLYVPVASNLSDEVLSRLEGKSGRDIRNIAEDIARKYLEEKIILNGEPDIEEVLEEYLSQINPTSNIK